MYLQLLFFFYSIYFFNFFVILFIYLFIFYILFFRFPLPFDSEKKERQQQLLQENEILRRIICSTHFTLAETFAGLEATIEKLNAAQIEQAQQKATENNKTHDDTESEEITCIVVPERLSPSMFELPISMTASALEEATQHQLQTVATLSHLLAEKYEAASSSSSLSSSSATPSNINELDIETHPAYISIQQELADQIEIHTKTVFEMQSQLEGLEQVIQEQDKLLQKNVFEKDSEFSTSSLEYLSDSLLLDEKEDLVCFFSF